jgi:hypothetical protein
MPEPDSAVPWGPAVEKLRRAAAMVVAMADQAILSARTHDVKTALGALPDTIRRLQWRCQRALVALQGGEATPR